MAYWKIKFDRNIDLFEKEILMLTVKIETICEIIKDIPVGHGLRQLFIKEEGKREKLLSGTLKDDNILNDIKGTAGIEGNTLNLDEIEEIINNDRANNIQEQEILNIKNLRKFIEQDDNFADKIISLELIKEIHKILTINIECTDNMPGVYRKHPIKVGKNYEGEKFDKIQESMREFIDFINCDEIININPVTRAIMAHFYLVTIHPFGDGNGRASRGLESFILYRSGYSIHGFYSLNNYYYTNYDEYFKMLDLSRFKYKGDLTEFIKFGLRGYLEELNKMVLKIKRFTIVKGYENYTKELFDDDVLTKRQYDLLEIFKHLPANRVPFNKIVRREISLTNILYQDLKSDKTIKRDLDNLLHHKLLVKDEKNYLIRNLDVMNEFTK